MNYREAKRKSTVRRLIGIAISIPALISTMVSFLKYLYFGLSDGTQFGEALARPFKTLVYSVYENTQNIFGVFWNFSPTLDLRNFESSENLVVLCVYFLIFVGSATFLSGKKLALRVRKIKEKIENQVIEESIKGEIARTRDQIEKDVKIPENSVFSQVHTLYIAPIVVGVILLLIAKFIGS